ncbi:acetolactate synthase [Pyrenochaeta sp. DS3sAY3a]|nr:acetolactate synthase [Pyrenochaeta sp. DS3sAY3a]
MSGGDVIHEMIVRHQVDYLFGYPGGAILPVFDSIYNSPHFKFIVPRHEQGAGHMAEGYARATGKPGVVLVTSGPGSTNVITPLQDALMDGTPLVVICGQVPLTSIGTDAFQEADITGMASACTKWTTMVQSVAELPRMINEAFDIATSGRPGPVLLSIPKDIAAGTFRTPERGISWRPLNAQAMRRRTRTFRHELDPSIKRAAALINMAIKPIILAGQGVLQSPEGPKLLKQLAEKACIPVTTTLQGLGSFDEEDPKALHMLGQHGSGYANMAIQHADLVLALGARFDDRVTGNISTFAPEAYLAAQSGRGGIIHFEVLRKNINKVVQATEAVEGDVAESLELLLPLIKPIRSRPAWFSDIEDWKMRFPWAYDEEPNRTIQPQAVIEALSKLTAASKAETIITTGVGQHQMWAAQFYRWRHPRSLITSGGLGTMGFGLPAAIGAKCGRPNAQVINIDGDASFCMSLNELSTAAENDIGVKTVILNNNEQGMVTQLQRQYYDSKFAYSHQKNPNFVRVGEAMGVASSRVVKPEELEEKLEWLLTQKGPALLEVIVEPKTLVLPTVKSGKALHDFVHYQKK